MGAIPWDDKEIEVLRNCAGLTDVEAAAAVERVRGVPRTPGACYFRAVKMDVPMRWTTQLRPADRPRMRYRPGNEEGADAWIGAEVADKAFREAMAREGRLPTPPANEPGTKTPKTLPRAGTGSCSSSSGWGV